MRQLIAAIAMVAGGIGITDQDLEWVDESQLEVTYDYTTSTTYFEYKGPTRYAQEPD